MSAEAQSLPELAQQLVVSFRGDRDAPNTTRRVLARLKNDTGSSSRREWTDVQAKLRGLIKTSRIKVEDVVADAYEKVLAKLVEHRRLGGTHWDERLPVNTSNLPQHVQFLLALSKPTSERTREVASSYLARPARLPKSEFRLFRDIMAEPFTGEHWGPGWDEEVREGWTDSEDSDSSSTASEDEVVTPIHHQPRVKSAAETAREAEARRREEEQSRLLLSKLALRELEQNAYWKSGGASVERRSDLQGWASLSLLPTLASPALPEHSTGAITAGQFQRELLFALTGRPGVMFSFSIEGACMIRPDHPDVATFSSVALDGLLREFALHASKTASLRAFIGATLSVQAPANSHLQSRTSETREAFSESCREVLHDINAWVADAEAAFLGAKPVSTTSTPLQLSRDFSRKFGELVEHLRDFIQFASSANGLLDAIHRAVVSPTTDEGVRPSLIRIFIQTATPMWRFLGDWVMRGMPVPASLLACDVDLALQEADDERPLSPEFFIQRDIDSAWSDEDFWEVGFVVPDHGWPSWLEGTQDVVMEGGKARGLLLSLTRNPEVVEDWAKLDTIINTDTTDIVHRLTEYVEPLCRESQRLLSEILTRDCALQDHLRAIDGLTLMQAPVVIEQWVDWLFNTMRQGRPWADFQLLTYSLRDAIEQQGADWMNAPAVRARAVRSQGRATLGDIRVDYLVPFPLSQLFTPTSMDMRSDVFTFLLRLLRARREVLEARQMAELQAGGRRDELRMIRRLRHALSWVLDAIWNWINGVLDVRSRRHARTLVNETSFQRLINLELEHSRQLRYFCFMHADTSTALETIDALLDLAKNLRHVAGSTVGVAQALPPVRPPRRRRRQQAESDDSDNDMEEVKPRIVPSQPDAGMAALEKMREELNYQVRSLARDVDQLASEGGIEAAEKRFTWGMLGFSLSDWKEIV